MAKRKDPTRAQMGRAGNYVAPVDYSGMDTSMTEDLKGYAQRPGESDADYMRRQRKRVNEMRVSKGLKPLKKQRGMKG